jgi:uncharacterized protein (DUF305 family)
MVLMMASMAQNNSQLTQLNAKQQTIVTAQIQESELMTPLNSRWYGAIQAVFGHPR